MLLLIGLLSEEIVKIFFFICGLNELIHTKRLEQCLVHCVSCH